MKKPASPILSRTAWVATAVAAVLAAGGGWLLTRPTPPLAITAPSPPAAGMPERPGVEEKAEAKAEVAATPAEAHPPQGQASMPIQNRLIEIDLRKVQRVLGGNGSPDDAREAARTLSMCKGAKGALDFAYKMRDQGDATWREIQKRGGFSAEKYIEAAEDAMRRCQLFDAATLARRGELLKRAYDGGAKDTALDYLIWLNAESGQAVDPELLGKLQRDARRSAEDGNFEALVVLSQAFNPKLGVTLMQRQAYLEARFLIEAETGGQALAAASRKSIEDFEKGMSQWSPMPRALSAEEQREADALTERVVGAWRKHQGSGG